MPFSTFFLGTKRGNDLKKKSKLLDFSKGTWPLVTAKIELDLHLARHKQLCTTSAHILLCSQLSPLVSLLFSPSYAIRNDTENNCKACSVCLKSPNQLFKKGMEKGIQRDRRESGEEK